MKDWTPKYTPQQREAIIAAVLDDHIKVPQVIQLASQGELGDLEPFTVPLSTAYGIVDKERRRRHANRSVQQQVDELFDTMLARTAHELANLIAKPKLTATEVTQLRNWLRLARELDRRPKPTNGHRSTPDEPERPSFIHTLAQQAAAAAEAPEDDDHEEPSTPDTSPTVTDAQRKAAEAILGVGNGLAAPTS
jgi:hypothetical protein